MNLVLAKECHFDLLWPLFSYCLKGLDSPTTEEEIRTEYKEIMQKGFFAFIEDENKVVGFIMGRIFKSLLDGSRQARDSYWFVLPEYRRKRVGTILLSAFESWAKAQGCKTMVITPSKFGSNEPDKVKDILIDDGYHLHGYQLRKTI